MPELPVSVAVLVDAVRPAVSWLVRRGVTLLSGVLGAEAVQLQEPATKLLMGVLSLASLALGEWLMRKHTSGKVMDAVKPHNN